MVLTVAALGASSRPSMFGVLKFGTVDSLQAPNPNTLTLAMPRSQDLNGVFAALSAAGIRVRSMRTESNRLEELFLRLTGEQNSDESRAALAAGAH